MINLGLFSFVGVNESHFQVWLHGLVYPVQLSQSHSGGVSHGHAQLPALFICVGRYEGIGALVCIVSEVPQGRPLIYVEGRGMKTRKGGHICRHPTITRFLPRR